MTWTTTIAGNAGYARPNRRVPAARAGWRDPSVRVVPLTGDASTRQYFRILRPDNPSVVLAVYDTPFTFDELPFVNVCRLFTSIPLPVPAIAGHADDLGILILEDLGDVTLQAHLGVTQPAEHDALYKQAVELVFRMQRKGAELQSDEFIPYGIAFDRDKLMWELNFFVKHFLEAYRGVDITPAAREALNEEWLTHRRRAGGRAARAVSSRLPQPESDAARAQAVHHRFSGRAHGTGHLRSGLAAARFVRRLVGGARRRADSRVSWGSAARHRRRLRHSRSTGGGSI